MDRHTPSGDATGAGEDIADIVRTSYRIPAGGDAAAWIDDLLTPEDHRLMAAPRLVDTGGAAGRARPRTRRGRRAPQASQ